MSEKVTPTRLNNIWDVNRFPLTIKVPGDMEDVHGYAIDEVAQEWNSALGMTVFTVEFDYDFEVTDVNDQNDLLAYSDGTIPIFFQEEWSKVSNDDDLIGIAYMFTTDGEIRKGGIAISLGKVEMTDDDDNGEVPLDEVDFQSLLLHELGHVLGFDHAEEEDSAMNATIFYGKAVQQLSPRDLERVYSKY